MNCPRRDTFVSLYMCVHHNCSLRIGRISQISYRVYTTSSPVVLECFSVMFTTKAKVFQHQIRFQNDILNTFARPSFAEINYCIMFVDLTSGLPIEITTLVSYTKCRISSSEFQVYLLNELQTLEFSNSNWNFSNVYNLVTCIFFRNVVAWYR